ILGARIGLYAGELLGLDLPQTDKRLLAIVETDGCFLDGVAEATGCRAGRRTMRIMDHGKAAVTFVDTLDGGAIRIWPHPKARQRALAYAPDHRDRWQAQLDGYYRMPASELLLSQAVELAAPLNAILGRAGVRIECEQCGEEVMNDREVAVGGRRLCRDCSGAAYFVAVGSGPESGPTLVRRQRPRSGAMSVEMVVGIPARDLHAVSS
ncbi:MAG: TraR/DksA C4-type zinc finger protein, partial [Chloroflexi bacterium]|nr:TraR/DksA C4-type zinc finger protein [Chloroflexota bacterium]